MADPLTEVSKMLKSTLGGRAPQSFRSGRGI